MTGSLPGVDLVGRDLCLFEGAALFCIVILGVSRFGGDLGLNYVLLLEHVGFLVCWGLAS